MADGPEQWRDHLLRVMIVEYRKMADGAKNDAAKCTDIVIRDRYLALSKAFADLADALERRRSN
jgi:hypothetical protein